MAAEHPSQTTSLPPTTQHPLHGIKLSFIRNVLLPRCPVEWSVREVCKQIIRVETKESKITYAEHIRLHIDPTAVNDKADSFISYAWDLKFNDVVSALPLVQDDVVDGDRFIWMDVLCSNQHNSVTSDEYIETFEMVLKSIMRAEVVVAPWASPIPPTRSWCCFEYSVLVRERIHFTCRMTPDDKADLKYHIKKNKLSQNFFDTVIGSINVEEAEAQRKEDKIKILAILKQRDTIDMVNKQVLSGLVTWLKTVVDETLKEVQPLTLEESSSLCARGFLLRSLGHNNEALEAFQTALNITLALTKGKETRETQAIKSNLAVSLSKVGNYVEAEPLLREILTFEAARTNNSEDEESTLERVLLVKSNLANVLRKLDKWEESESLYQIVITAYRGGSHAKSRELAVALNNFARLKQKQKKHDDAVRLLREALSIDCIVYGTSGNRNSIVSGGAGSMQYPNHREVATDLHNLALSLKALNEKKEAALLGIRAYEIFVRVLGKDHEDTLDAKRWLRVSMKVNGGNNGEMHNVEEEHDDDELEKTE